MKYWWNEYKWHPYGESWRDLIIAQLPRDVCEKVSITVGFSPTLPTTVHIMFYVRTGYMRDMRMVYECDVEADGRLSDEAIAHLCVVV